MVAGTQRVRSICRICLKEHAYSVYNTVSETYACCNEPLLIAGKTKTDIHAVSGTKNARIDPIALYRETHAPQQIAQFKRKRAKAIFPRPEVRLNDSEQELGRMFEAQYNCKASAGMIKFIHMLRLFRTVSVEQVIETVFPGQGEEGHEASATVKAHLAGVRKLFGDLIKIEVQSKKVYVLRRIGPPEAPFFERK